MKRALAAAALCMVLFAPVCAAAIDFDYSGPLYPATGAPVTAEDYASVQTAGGRVMLSDRMYYDQDSRSFVFPVGSGNHVLRSNVPDGAITTEIVSLYSDTELSITVYRNGSALENPNLATLAGEGSYVVSANVGSGTENVMRFTIVGPITNLPGGYPMPDGFFITDATVDEEEADYRRDFIGMEEEGHYLIDYIAPEAAVRMSLETTIDRTPPELVLEGRQDKLGRFHSRVDVTGIEQGDAVVLLRDGEAVQFPNDRQIKDTGVYTIQVYDSAGNSTAQQFTILLYFDLNSMIFFGLILLSLVAIVGYIVFNRKRMKII